jgi:protein-S-isoprenylcysteine O-methyltransferase Ste14
MEISLLRLYLLSGLVLHKVVWQLLKRGRHQAETRPVRPATRLIQLVKISILAGILIQTVIPVVFPMTAGGSQLPVIGTAIYTLGLAIALTGRLQLGDNWADIETARVLGHQEVVSSGIYRYIRHPIYTGDLLLLLGLELALNSWLLLAVPALALVVLRQAIREERMLHRTLAGYGEYSARTKRFVPFVV